jgi:hypothetical protein
MKFKRTESFGLAIVTTLTAALSNYHPVFALSEGLEAPVTEHLIPASSAVVVEFQNSINVDAQQNPYPMTGELLQPLIDEQGQAVVPAGTPVMVQLQPDGNGITIKGQAIVFGGRVIPIQADSALIPSVGMTDENQVAQDQQDASNAGTFVGSTVDALSPFGFGYRGYSLGNALSSLVGLSESHHKRQIAQVAADTPYILTLQTPISVTSNDN